MLLGVEKAKISSKTEFWAQNQYGRVIVNSLDRKFSMNQD
jgi:hypothetical protein